MELVSHTLPLTMLIRWLTPLLLHQYRVALGRLLDPFLLCHFKLELNLTMHCFENSNQDFKYEDVVKGDC